MHNEIANKIRATLPELPRRMRKLPVDKRGYPVPWFVHWEGNEPKFQIIGKGKILAATQLKKCWICGEQMGVHVAFVLGSVSGINRTSPEPPSHLDCAEFACKACPYLTTPEAVRSMRGIKDIEITNPPGEGSKRNPGVTLLWVTRSYKPFSALNERGEDGVLFQFGSPETLYFFRESRKATRLEIDESIISGMPLLLKQADKDGKYGHRALQRAVWTFIQLLAIWAPYEKEVVNDNVSA